MEQVGLQLHPDKTKIVYCKDDNRRGCARADVVHVPGIYGSVPGRVQTRHGQMFTAFAPAISPACHCQAISGEVRRWRIHLRTDTTLADLAELDQPDRARLDDVLRPVLPVADASPPQRINAYLVRWARKKYRRLAPFKHAERWWDDLVNTRRDLFAHWHGPARSMDQMTRAV